MKSALVYDWLVCNGGGECTLEHIYKIFPSPIHTLIHQRKSFEKTPLSRSQVNTSHLQRFPFIEKYYRNLLPIFPKAIEQFDLSEYDLILSCSHAVAKGVITNSDQLHICYCFTPMRYAWDLYWEYLGTMNPVQKVLAKRVLAKIRQWDFITTSRVDHFIACSQYVAGRIKRAYGRESTVIYPPVETEGTYSQENKENYYVTASRLVSYKNTSLIVEAFSKMPDKRLIVIGEGPELNRIKRVATKNVEIIGRQPRETLRELLGGARAFIYAAVEDFGILPVEAQAMGTPVIAYRKGGLLETVIEGETGLFFNELNCASLLEAIQRFEKKEFSSTVCSKHAQNFSAERFRLEYRKFVEEKWASYCESSLPDLNHQCLSSVLDKK